MKLATSVVGSHGLPGWLSLAREAMQAGRLGPLDLRELMEDATQAALLDQERAGVDVLGTGEMMRVRFIVGFLTSDHLGAIPVDTPGLGFGLGFQVRRDAGIAGIPGTVGEYGWAGNAGTLFWVDPREKLIAIYMVQVSDGDRIAPRNQFRTLVESTIVDPGAR